MLVFVMLVISSFKEFTSLAFAVAFIVVFLV